MTFIFSFFFLFKENDFWSPEPCKICQCIAGASRCFTRDCSINKFLKSNSEIKFISLENNVLNANNLNFYNNLKPYLNRNSIIEIMSGKLNILLSINILTT